MATFNGGRMVALLLCMLFANVSFAQDDNWETVAFYMVDPMTEEKIAQEVLDYIDKRNDPLTWETKNDFNLARDGQMKQVESDNDARIEAAKDALMADMRTRGDGTSKWYPSWIPLGTAELRPDSLFKNILTLEGLPYLDGRKQTLREFFELDGDEPDGAKPDGSQKFWSCDDDKRRCRKEFYADFRALVEIHDASRATTSSTSRIADEDGCGCQLQAVPDETLPVISFSIRAKSTDERIEITRRDTSFVAELNEQGITRDREETKQDRYVEFDWDSIELLQPAAMDSSTYVIDTTPYSQPAAKAVSSTETSSWGRIKATFAD